MGQGYNFCEFVSGGAFVPSGTPTAHFSADTIVGLNDGEKGSQWDDQISIYYLANSNATYQPIYKTSIQNGLPIVRFNSGADNRLYNAAIEIALTSTIFLVIQQDAWIASTGVFDSYPVPNAHSCFQFTATPNLTLYRGTLWDSGGFALGSFKVMTVQFKTGGQLTAFRLNGVEIDTGNTSGLPTAADGFTLGGTGNSETNGSPVSIGEVIIYDGTESAAANETGLMSKWGIS
jgi:hypothetical protein